MLQTSLVLMKSLNKTETPIFCSVMCFLFPKAIFLTFIIFGMMKDIGPFFYSEISPTTHIVSKPHDEFGLYLVW